MPSLLICTQDAGTSEPPRWTCRIFNLTRGALETSFIISAIAHCSRMEHFISTDGKKLVIVQKRYTFKSTWVLVFNYMDEVNRVWCGWLCGKNDGPLYDFHFSDFKRENSAPIFPPSWQHNASVLVWLLPDWKPVKARQSYILCYLFDSSHHVRVRVRVNEAEEIGSVQ